MSMVICPECGTKCSEYTNACVSCGFPIKQFMANNKLIDTNKVFMCPRCAFYSGGGLSKTYIKCKYCNIPVIQLEINDEELEKELYKIYKTGNKECEAKFIKKDNRNQFSQEAYEHRLAMIKQENQNRNNQNVQADQISQKPQIKCPYCNSTDIKKISFTKKAISIGGLGILSNKIGKTYQCKKCKSTW